jgi:hypothetical protein
MADFEVRYSSAADRLLKTAALPAGNVGFTSDEYEAFVGSADTPRGRAVTSPQAPKSGLDVRRLFGFASQGQQSTYTDVSAVVQDASGMVMSPKPALLAGGGTDIVATGYVLPYELADGGTMTIEAVGTFKCGSIAPMILAKLRIAPPGSAGYVAPQYERALNSGGTAAAPLDVSGLIANTFEWSSRTVGLNALAGFEALNISAANMTPGEFQWRLTMKVHALGRWAKWQRGDDDSATKDRNCWVEATLEWGALQYNMGARIGDGIAGANPLGTLTLQYSPFVKRNTASPANGTIRGAIYTFMGQQWLCHAASDTGAQLLAGSVADWVTATGYVFGDIVESLGVGAGVYYRCVAGHTSSAAGAGAGLNEPGVGDDEHLFWKLVYYDEVVAGQMLAEEAPGIGLHWREFFVPAVNRATISGFATVDWTVGNEIQLELGGPQQEDLGNTWGTYANNVGYTAEAGISPFTVGNRGVTAGGVVYSPKTFLYVATWGHIEAGVNVPLWTAAPTGASPDSERAWRALPATLRDTMRVQQAHGYIYGRRNGVAERRV